MDLVVLLGITFLVALVVAWLLLFPATLDALKRDANRVSSRTGDAAQRLSQWIAGRIHEANAPSRNRVGGVLASIGNSVRDHGPMLAGSLALILLPVAVMLLLIDQRRLPGFDDRAHESNAVVSSLLEGEHLVPPPPLPPDIFVTREVEMIRPYLGGADRDWSRLDPDFGQTLLHLFKTMEARGYPMVLIEGYRSPERQAFLQSAGNSVTNAGAWQSYHQFGLAADCAFFRNGKLVISEHDPWAAEGYRLYGETAEAAGLTWGGRWTLHDLGHIERHKAGLLKK